MKQRNVKMNILKRGVMLVLAAVMCLLCFTACSESETDPGHVHTAVDGSAMEKSATCLTPGYTTYECKTCGIRYRDNYKNPLGHQVIDDNPCTRCSKSGNALLYTRLDDTGAVSDTGSYIMFGSYPQTKVAAGTPLVSTLSTAAGDLPKQNAASQAWESYNWTAYPYYTNAKIGEYMWYQDINQGGAWYRGIYYTSYRPNSTGATGSEDASYQDDYGYESGYVYWFRFEPIQWRIVEESEGVATLVCDMIIDSMEYDDNATDSNNYAESNVRAWLNDTFYKTAFSSLEQELIQLTSVDNGAESTGWEKNEHAGEPTSDHVYLPSYAEATTYFDSSAAREKTPTDYAKGQGTYVCLDDESEFYGNGWWWLRSPNFSDATMVRRINLQGGVGLNNVYHSAGGVCPMIRIKL